MQKPGSGAVAGGAVGLVLIASLATAVHHHTHHKPVPHPTPITTTTFVPPSTSVLPTSCHYNGALPDSSCTPGETNPQVTQANIKSTICVKGWTTTVRPPLSYTQPLKLKDMTAYGVGGQSEANFELDHLVPLEVGGAPSDPRNLFPEHGGTANAPLVINGEQANSKVKDAFENYERVQVCAGKTTLAAAQQAFETDWLSAYNAAGRPPDPYGYGDEQ